MKIEQIRCANCHSELVEKSLDWICWECGWEVGFQCWFCDYFTKGIVEKCSRCGCPNDSIKKQ